MISSHGDVYRSRSVHKQLACLLAYLLTYPVERGPPKVLVA